MRNLIFLVFLAIVGFLVAGYFLDWYDIKGVPGGDGNTRLQIDIHTSKIREDIDRGGDKLKDGLERVKEAGERKDTTAKVETPSTTKPPVKNSESSFFEFLERIGEKSKNSTKK
jgi:hypothetical protein